MDLTEVKINESKAWSVGLRFSRKKYMSGLVV